MRAHHSTGASDLHHVSLRVEDIDRSIAFYRDGLGLSLASTFELEGRRFAVLEAGTGSRIELVEAAAPVRSVADGDVFWHLAFRAVDVERSLATLVTRGATMTVPVKCIDLVNGVTGRATRVRVAFVRGPDGEQIELVEELES